MKHRLPLHPRHLLLLPGLAGMLALSLASCVGTKVALHASGSTFGMDIDTTPPTTDIGLSRSELAIQPGFAGGQTPSSVMSFNAGAESTFLGRFFFGTGSTFATGQAAANLATKGTGSGPQTGESTPANNDDSLDLVEDPKRPTVWEMFFGPRKRQAFSEAEMFPLVTGTKTNYGLCVQWDASTQAPRAVRVGFNRKEMSYAPVHIRKTREGETGGLFKVKIPSVLAAHQQKTAGDKGVKFDYVQYLSTGKAAERLGNDPEVRAVLMKNIAKTTTTNDAVPAEPGTVTPSPTTGGTNPQ
ncbi:MAG: hypothetical protein ACO1TE_24035 [Prosthecobacter sp.]